MVRRHVDAARVQPDRWRDACATALADWKVRRLAGPRAAGVRAEGGDGRQQPMLSPFLVRPFLLSPPSFRYILVDPQGCDVCNHLSLFLCVADYDKLLPGEWWKKRAERKTRRRRRCGATLFSQRHARVGPRQLTPRTPWPAAPALPPPRPGTWRARWAVDPPS